MLGTICGNPSRAPSGHLVDLQLRARLRNLVALIAAIETGELLSTLPDCPVAREYHRAGLVLLQVVGTEIGSISQLLGDEPGSTRGVASSASPDVLALSGK